MFNAYRDDYSIFSFVHLIVHFCAPAKLSVKSIEFCPNMLMLSGQTASNVFERINLLKCLKKV